MPQYRYLTFPCSLCLCQLPLQEEEKKAGSLSREEIEQPDPGVTSKMKHGTYDKLDADGLCPPGGCMCIRALIHTHGEWGLGAARHVRQAGRGRAVPPGWVDIPPTIMTIPLSF